MLARYFITLLWAGSLAFAQTTTTPNMNLALPVVGQEIGPQWATDLNNAFDVVDQHDHTPGKGVQIPPAGLNINSALTFNDNPATNLSEIDLTNGSAASSNSGALSVAPGGGTGVGDLYYTDFAGNQIQLTKSGQVNVVASSIPGESYSAGTFIWDQTQSSLPTTPANFDIGSITLRPNIAATTAGTQLVAPTSGNYTINLPVPQTEGYSGTPNFVTMNSSGAQTNNYYLDGTTLTTSGSVVQVANGSITNAKLASANIQTSSSSGAFSGTSTTPAQVTNLSVTLTTVGRPVMVMLISDADVSGLLAQIKIANTTSGDTAFGQIEIVRDSSPTYVYAVGTGAIPGQAVNVTIPASSISLIDTPAAGTHSYNVMYSVSSTGANTMTVAWTKLLAFEM